MIGRPLVHRPLDAEQAPIRYKNDTEGGRMEPILAAGRLGPGGPEVLLICVVAVLLIAGAHVPVIPSIEDRGRAGIVAPEQ